MKPGHITGYANIKLNAASCMSKSSHRGVRRYDIRLLQEMIVFKGCLLPNVKNADSEETRFVLF